MWLYTKSNKVSWKDRSIKDFEDIIVEKPTVDFKGRPSNPQEKFFELHYAKLFVGVYELVQKAFSGDGDLVGKQSPWVHQYPDEFYQHVKTIARSDPNCKHWEGLLRYGEERIALVTGVIMRTLDAHVFSSLLFGASQKHEEIITAHDIDLIDSEGFERSHLLAITNKTYLDDNNGIPPLFWEGVGKVSSQIAAMLLPLYNVVGRQSYSDIQSLEEFAPMLYRIVAYAAWLSLMTRLTPGIVVHEWVQPGDAYELGQVNLANDVFCKSIAKSGRRRRRQKNNDQRTVGRVKISACPKVLHHALFERGMGWTTYEVLRPHVAYYAGLPTCGDEATILPLEKYIWCVRKPQGMPPVGLVLTIMAVFIASVTQLYVSTFFEDRCYIRHLIFWGKTLLQRKV